MDFCQSEDVDLFFIHSEMPECSVYTAVVLLPKHYKKAFKEPPKAGCYHMASSILFSATDLFLESIGEDSAGFCHST